MAVVNNDLVVGAWRNGLDQSRTGSVVKDMLQKEAAGFSMYPPESTVVELTKLLDAYDEFSEEMLVSERVPGEAVYTEQQLREVGPELSKKATKKRGA